MFPEDFFGSPNQYKTIQTQVNKNKEHPKIINPALLKTKTNQHYIIEIKEEKCEESLEIPKNKTLKIIIPNNISNEEISTSGSCITPNTPNNPYNPVIHTEPNKNKKKGSNIKDKLISNNSLNNKLQNVNENNNNKDENIDLYYPMAFTFNRKEKKSRTLNNNKRRIYKYNKSLEGKNNKNKLNKDNKNNKNNKDKIIKEKKTKSISFQKNNENKIIKENKHQRNNSLKNYNNKDNNKNKNNSNNKCSNYGYRKSYSCEKSDYQYKNEKNMIKNNIQKEIRKNTRNNTDSLYDRKARSAKKSKETINILTIKNNKNLLKRNNKDDKNGLYNKNNLKNFKSEYNNKKKEILHSRVKSEINQILRNLPENYEKFPEINNKFELLLKNINDFKFVLDKNKNNSKKSYKQ